MILGCLFYGFWEIWKARCRIKFDEATPNIHSLIKRIYTHVYELSLQVTPKRVASTWESTILESKNIPVRLTKVKRGRWLLWSKPTMGMVKMNTDDSCKGLRGSDGGILRSHSGLFLYGFSLLLSHNDIVRAELDAILEGIRLCKRMNIKEFVIETDCSVAYHMILNPSNTRCIKIIFREENRVADLFAKMAHNFQTRVGFFRSEDLSSHILKYISFDKALFYLIGRFLMSPRFHFDYQ